MSFTAIAAPPAVEIDEIVRSAVAEWRSQPSDFPDLGNPLSRREQNFKERRADRCVAAIESELRSRNLATPKLAIERITAEMVEFIPEALDLDVPDEGPGVESLLKEGLAEVGFDLARRARRLDPTVSIVDILQAARNAWVACGVQAMLGKQIRLTPGIFAYSMLYPYSDNFLDDGSVSREAKLTFSERFESCLEGEQELAATRLEGVVWELVAMIEDEFPRDEYPGVWASLLAIHRAQTRSIDQMHREGLHSGGAPNRASRTLDLTVTKGGTSVLADAYLAAGHLTAFEAKVAFDWGVVLQLGDDLQDFHGDRARGSRTLFTGAAAFGALDGVTNKTFHFSRSVMREVAALPTCPAVMKSLLERSSRLFLIRSVAGAAPFFTKPYLGRLEQYSPFTFRFLKNRERRCYRRRAQYARLFEGAVGD